MARFRKNDFFKWAQKIKSVFCFIPHTHEGCDSTRISERSASCRSFNPHTHEGCDLILLSGCMHPKCFNPHTHEGCDLRFKLFNTNFNCFNPHTHEGCDQALEDDKLFCYVSIHTPTKGVTSSRQMSLRPIKFQSTHPRRV